MSGEVTNACCCQPGQCTPGILITTGLEAVTQIMSSFAFTRYGIWGTTKGVCPLATDECTTGFWKNVLSWECNVTAIIHDDVEDLARIRKPQSGYCFNCGIQGVGNCSCGAPPTGSASCCGCPGFPIPCDPPYGCNQAGQYTGHICLRPLGYYESIGGCSCGCTGYGPNGVIACHDTSDIIREHCYASCNQPEMTKYFEGPVIYYPGGFSWQTNSYYKRDGNYCFLLHSTTTRQETVNISMPTCAGGAGGSTAGTAEPIVFTVQRYNAPVGGFEGGISGRSDCACTCCKPQLPGPNVGIGDYVNYVSAPVWQCDYGITLTRVNAVGPCAGNWTVECDGAQLIFYLNGVQQGVVALNQTAANVALAVAAATGNCIQVPDIGCPIQNCPRWPQQMCVGPAIPFAQTAITAVGYVCGTSVLKTTMLAGDSVPPSWVGTSNPKALLPRYEGFANVFTGTVYYDTGAGSQAQFAAGFEVGLDDTTCWNLDSQAADAGICGFPNHPLIGYMPDEGWYPDLLSNGTVDCHCNVKCPAFNGEPPNNGYDISYNTGLFPYSSLLPIGTGKVNQYEYSDYGCCNDRPDCTPGENLDCPNNSIENVTVIGGCSDCANPNPCGDCGCLIDPAYNVPGDECKCANCCLPRFPVYKEQQHAKCREEGTDKVAFHGGIRYTWWLRRTV